MTTQITAPDELSQLRQRVAELEGQLRTFTALSENATDGISATDLEARFFYANPAYQKMTGYGPALVGMSIFELYAEDAAYLGAAAEQVMTQGFWQGLLTCRRPDGSSFPAQVAAFLMRDAAGAPRGFGAIARDMTDQLRHEQERTTLQEQVIAAQQAALRELSTPLIPISNGVVAMPLIGSIDSTRTQQVIETLLSGVAESRATTAILDITGVPVVDTQVADGLLRAAQAVRLLGAQVILTGIRPEVAQTLVGLGLNLSGIVTHSTLQSGIAYALAGR
jgi:PAS domain S-box-containing protein